MVRVLSVSDEVVESLVYGAVADMAPEVILAAGDLPFDYLELLMLKCDAPLIFVPGNHDPDLSGYRRGRTGWTRAGMPTRDPGPMGAINVDRTVVTTVDGLRVAGLGGSVRYNAGPNQYHESAQRFRAMSLRIRCGINRFRWRSARVDVLLTHSPARGYGDGEDLAHRGFRCLIPLVRALAPTALVHGHVHPFGTIPDEQPMANSSGGKTHVINTVGYCLFEIEPARNTLTILRRRHGT